MRSLQGCVETQMAAELQDDWLNLTQKERDLWMHCEYCDESAEKKKTLRWFWLTNTGRGCAARHLLVGWPWTEDLRIFVPSTLLNQCQIESRRGSLGCLEDFSGDLWSFIATSLFDAHRSGASVWVLTNVVGFWNFHRPVTSCHLLQVHRSGWICHH